MQLQDDKIRDIVKILQERTSTNKHKQIRTDFCIEKGRLYKKVGGQLKWVVPKDTVWRIIKSCHDDIGHYGIERTLQHLSNDYWFPRMRNKVKRYIASCVECAYFKRPSGKPEGELHCLEKSAIPFRTVHVDHLGPFPKSLSGNTHVLGIIDGFTKYTILQAVKNTTTTPVIRILTDVFSLFGSPFRIITDRGTAYTSKRFKEFCEDTGVQHIKTAARTPRANGQIERCNRTILNALSTMTTDTKSWDKTLRAVQWGLNTSQNETTRKTPFELLLGFQPRDSLGNKVLLALHDETALENNFNIDRIRAAAEEDIKTSQEKQKQRYDKRHSCPKAYKEGDLVLIERPSIATGESRKLDPKYKGPYIVTKVLGNDRYVIKDIPHAQRTQRKFESIYSSDNMKPYCSLPEEELTDEEYDDDEIEDDLTSQDGRVVTTNSSASVETPA